jgi:chemotaxis protein MotB
MRPSLHGNRFGRGGSKSGGQSGDDWMGTYADAITLLMAFFVILLSTAKIDEAKYARVANAIVQDLQHRRDPEAQPVAAPVSAEELAFESKLASRLEPLNEIENVAVESAKDALTIEFTGGLLYASGSAELKKTAFATLAQVSQALGDVDLNEYMITVEGHTDDTPIRTARFPSNWELSAGRATSVVRALVEAGLDRSQVSALAFADTRPVVSNTDAEGRPSTPNRERNRRVVIRVARR